MRTGKSRTLYQITDLGPEARHSDSQVGLICKSVRLFAIRASRKLSWAASPASTPYLLSDPHLSLPSLGQQGAPTPIAAAQATRVVGQYRRD